MSFCGCGFLYKACPTHIPNFKTYFYSDFSVCICVVVCRCPWMPEVDVRSPGAGVAGSLCASQLGNRDLNTGR